MGSVRGLRDPRRVQTSGAGSGSPYGRCPGTVHRTGRPRGEQPKATNNTRANERMGREPRNKDALDRNEDRDDKDDYGERDGGDVEVRGDKRRAEDHNKVDDHAAVVVHAFRLDEKGARSPTSGRPTCQCRQPPWRHPFSSAIFQTSPSLVTMNAASRLKSTEVGRSSASPAS